VRLGVKPEINAICTLVIGFITCVIIAASVASKLSIVKGESAAPV
jgi:putrescine transport system permease protein